MAGINGIHSYAESENKVLEIFSADSAVMALDSTVDRYINCRKSDITVRLPGELGSNTEGDSTRRPRTVSEFPTIEVATVYGSVALPPADLFYFRSIGTHEVLQTCM